jgi:hypothetical protein
VIWIAINAPHGFIMQHYRSNTHFDANIVRPDHQPARVDISFRLTKSMSREELQKMIIDLLQVSWRMDEGTDHAK